MVNVGKNLKRLRAARGLTQEQVAERLHVTRQTVSAWETGRTQPDVETLTALAALFSAEIEELIYGKRRRENGETDLAAARRHTMTVVFTVLGTLLTAAGLIMVFVYFWRELNAVIQTALAFLPLLAGAGAGISAVCAKKESVFRREAAAVLWFAGVMATNALINAVYAVDFGFLGLLTADVALMLPAVFLLRSAAGFAATLAMTTAAVLPGRIAEEPAEWQIAFWSFYAAVFGACLLFHLKNKLPPGIKRFCAAALLVALPLNAAAVLKQATRHSFFVLLYVLLQTYFLCCFLAEKTKRTQLPTASAALIGFACEGFLFTIQSLNGDAYSLRLFWTDLPLYVLPCALCLAASWFLLGGRKRIPKETQAFSAAMLLLMAAALLLRNAPAALILLPSLCFGALAAILGVRQARLLPANVGMLNICAVVALVLFHIRQLQLLQVGALILAFGLALLLLNRRIIKKIAAGKRAAANALDRTDAFCAGGEGPEHAPEEN